MEKSATIAELAKALCKAQATMQKAIKGSVNPHFKSKYADLESIWDACREALISNGLAVVQTNAPWSDGVVIETTLLHTSGEYITGSLVLRPVKNDPQGVGSAITYGRRYGLASMVGICAEDDDDANAASTHNKHDKSTPQAQAAANKSYEAAKGRVEAPKNDTIPVHETLIAELGAYCSGNRERMEAVLKECSVFTGNDGKEIYLRLDKLSEKKPAWLGTTLGKLRKKMSGDSGVVPAEDAPW
ncbi:ERF family protein [Candidatus Magnetobacterium casense]|uniref:ERF family protein n=1 Tax=Candidatus Magnetobacterium casense TaxID=1455061 RepID=A0ABS6S3Z3_9BACT|nr:ERF family protein [Candidatus Magnetobacterium casensis]MBV6343128.1 ERF family protein [Candidatus Magnetobacterium casensis]